eukprot:CAMPEP_0168501592 /NCGR_PEP_ID=MMETSP0228-20121227/74883_1 /TAXON_ID=133427 /ORGANISM="Protoceratium reticulatum, Strain CCCM 535 (=CCMP 1889)" /LENGTH=487 /DNA_ID=CAMNT_0008518549 /DNA_START=38 /DNA_END=1501 /DNA_ORIENTATION=+
MSRICSHGLLSIFVATLAVLPEASDPGVSQAVGIPPSALSADDECSGIGSGSDKSECTLNALQLRSSVSSRVDSTSNLLASAGCHTITESDNGGDCWDAIQWAKHVGIVKHPEWYEGMDPNTSSLKDWQLKIYTSNHPNCPLPCGVREHRATWCRNAEGRGGSVGHLIRANMEPEPFDVLGFQECEDPGRVMEPAGLQKEFTVFQGKHAICMGYRTEAWSLVVKGESDVAEDMPTEFYGSRGTQWMRLLHKKSGRGLFFVNHHGPLSVNSGGICGGRSTANNLMNVMSQNAQVGDMLVLVGDFNANAASETVQTLWPHLLHVYNSKSFGGVDNIFSNVHHTAVVSTKDLGSGGSDHHAIAAVMQAGPMARKAQMPNEISRSVEALREAKGTDGCLIEPQVQYTFPPDAWTLKVGSVSDPRLCCYHCQRHSGCEAWVWTEWDSGTRGALCELKGAGLSGATSKDGYASGLPKTRALAHADLISKRAKS